VSDARFPYEAELPGLGPLPAGTTAVRVCPDPVFVIGSPRSGTSILAWALSQHDEMCTFSESDFIFHLFGRGQLDVAYRIIGGHAGGGWLAENDVSREEFFAYLGLGLNALLSSRARGPRWVDQSPSHTLIARKLAELFPGASFLHILRDGRQVVNSMVNSGFEEDWAKDFRTACRTWTHFVRVAAAFEIEWPDRCLTVPYAELVRTPDTCFERVQDFIRVSRSGLPAVYCRTHRINSSYARDSMRTGDGGRSFSTEIAWRGPENPWLDWSEEQRAIFVEEAGEVMLQHGFAEEEEFAR
jgi:hypothetical protein